MWTFGVVRKVSSLRGCKYSANQTRLNYIYQWRGRTLPTFPLFSVLCRLSHVNMSLGRFSGRFLAILLTGRVFLRSLKCVLFRSPSWFQLHLSSLFCLFRLWLSLNQLCRINGQPHTISSLKVVRLYNIYSTENFRCVPPWNSKRTS